MNRDRYFSHCFVFTFFFLFSVSSHSAVCDVDDDGDVDRDDTNLIVADRGKPVSGPEDPRDGVRDGKIDNQDVRFCSRSCTLARCASPVNNQPPIANAGEHQNALVGQVVKLDLSLIHI